MQTPLGRMLDGASTRPSSLREPFRLQPSPAVLAEVPGFMSWRARGCPYDNSGGGAPRALTQRTLGYIPVARRTPGPRPANTAAPLCNVLRWCTLPPPTKLRGTRQPQPPGPTPLHGAPGARRLVVGHIEGLAHMVVQSSPILSAGLPSRLAILRCDARATRARHQAQSDHPVVASRRSRHRFGLPDDGTTFRGERRQAGREYPRGPTAASTAPSGWSSECRTRSRPWTDGEILTARRKKKGGKKRARPMPSLTIQAPASPRPPAQCWGGVDQQKTDPTLSGGRTVPSMHAAA
jgi:hypothetical protein